MARHSVSKVKRGWQSYLKIGLLISTLFAVAFASYSYWVLQSTLRAMQLPPAANGQGAASGGSSTTTLPSGPRTILVMGTDARNKKEAAQGSRTDTMFLMRVDPAKKKVSAVFVPRDSWVDVPGHGFRKINSAHALGQGPLAEETIESLLGVEVNYYMVASWKALRQYVNTVGPVKMYVNKRIYDPVHSFTLDEGCQELNGYESVQFVRFRKDARGDLGRIERQQQFIRAVADQTMTLRILPKLPRVMKIVGSNVVTNMPSKEMLSLANLMRRVPQDQIDMIQIPGELSRRSGQSVIIPDEDSIARIMARVKEGLPAAEETGDEGERGDGSSEHSIFRSPGLSSAHAAPGGEGKPEVKTWKDCP